MSRRKNPDDVSIHTDGSCWPNPNGPGGWALVARWKDRQRTRHGFSASTTNNEMELMGVYHALLFVAPSSRPLFIYTDSRYVCNCVNKWVDLWRQNGWINSQGEEVKHRELINDVRRLRDKHRTHNNNNTHIQWTKGHAGNRNNELADRLAGNARIDQLTDWEEEDYRIIL